MRIYQVEGMDKILANMSEAASKEAWGYLEELGVTVMTGTMVADYDGRTLSFKNGKNEKK